MAGATLDKFIAAANPLNRHPELRNRLMQAQQNGGDKGSLGSMMLRIDQKLRPTNNRAVVAAPIRPASTSMSPQPQAQPMQRVRPMGAPAAALKLKKGGSVKASSASKRADGCATKGKTKGRFV